MTSASANRRFELQNPLLFVGGCPRSGTTLLQRMLDGHSQLAVANDAHFLPRALEIAAPDMLGVARQGKPVPLTNQLVQAVTRYHRFYRMRLDEQAIQAASDKAVTYQEFVSDLYRRFAELSDKPWGGEKTPDYVRHFPLLGGMFPHAKMVHIVRDGRDVALSLRQWANKTKGPGRLAFWDVDPIAVSALWWRQFAESEYSPVARRVWELRYEDLIEDPAGCLQPLTDFLGLAYEESMVAFSANAATIARRAGGHANALSDPAHSVRPSGMNDAKRRWLPATKGLRDWRSEMSAEDLAVFEQLAAPTLEKFGYELVGGVRTTEVGGRVDQALAWWHDHAQDRRVRASSESTPSETRADGLGCSFARSQNDAGEMVRQAIRIVASDAGLVRRDRAIVELGSVFSGERLKQFFTGQGIEWPAGCEIRYLRYKPGTSCSALVWGSPSDPVPTCGQAHSPAGSSQPGRPWGVVIAYSPGNDDKLQGAERRLTSEMARIGGRVCWERSVVCVPFPFDFRLRGLEPFWKEAADCPLIRWLVAETDHPSAQPHIAKQVLSYKPLRRCVIRTQTPGRPDQVVRFYTEKEYPQAKLVSKRLSSLAGYDESWVRHFDGAAAVVVPWLDGTPWSPLSWLAGDSRSVAEMGRLLARLHETPEPKIRVMTSADVLRLADENVAAIEALSDADGQLARTVLALAAKKIEQAATRLTCLHGDLHQSQLLRASNGDLHILDWDRAVNGPPEWEWATWMGHMQLASLVRGMVPIFDGSTWHPAVAACMTAYEDAGGLPLVEWNAFAALGLLHAAILPFRRRRGDWGHLLRQMVDAARSAISCDDPPCAVATPHAAVAPPSEPGRETVRRGQAGASAQRRVFSEIALTADSSKAPLEALDETSWLSLALDHDAVLPLLSRAVGQVAQGPLLWHLKSVSIEKLLPDRRALVQYCLVDSTSDAEIRLFGKVRKKGLDLPGLDIANRLHRAARHARRLCVARPLGCWFAAHVWLQTRLPGTEAHQLFSCTDAEGIWELVGEALAELHQLRIHTRRSHSWRDECSILEKSLVKVAASRPEWCDELARILDGARRLLERTSPNPETGIHRDFYPAQVIVDGSRIGVVDADLFAWGDPAVDIGNCLAHISEHALRECGDVQAYAHVERGFLTGYRRQNAGVTDDSIRAYHAVSLARHIAISHRLADRRGVTKEIMERAAAMLVQSRAISTRLSAPVPVAPETSSAIGAKNQRRMPAMQSDKPVASHQNQPIE